MTTSLRRALVLVLLTAVSLAPAVSRAHLRVSTHPTPAQENARFKWSNSCERVPLRPADAQQQLLIPAERCTIAADASLRSDSHADAEIVRVASVAAAPPGLRAPPSFIF